MSPFDKLRVTIMLTRSVSKHALRVSNATRDCQQKIIDLQRGYDGSRLRFIRSAAMH
jgi:hypothetical protein